MARPPSDIRDRLIRAALVHFSKSGVDGASLRTVAADAGSSVGMISYHFGGKEGLVDALIEHFYSPFVLELRQLASAEPDPLLRLRELLHRIGRLTEDERLSALIMFREVTMRTERVSRLFTHFLNGHFPIVMEAVQDASDAGQLREVPAFKTTIAIVGALAFPQFIQAPALIGAGNVDVVDNTISVLLEGLLPR